MAVGYGPRAAYYREVRKDNPVAYWRLGGNANDEMGTYNGTAVGSPSYVAGALADGNQAIALNGTSQAVDCGDLSFLDGKAPGLTYEAWVNLTSSPEGFRSLLGNYDGSEAQHQAYLGANAGKIAFCVAAAAAASLQRIVYTTGTISTGTWYHVCGVWVSSTVCKIYLNGVDQTVTQFVAGTVNNLRASSTDKTYIGAMSSPLSFFSNGSIDEVAIYTTALSAARILAHYTAR